MGRSAQKKREKRKRQKQLKKDRLKKAREIGDHLDQSDCTIGSPTFPPPFCSSPSSSFNHSTPSRPSNPEDYSIPVDHVSSPPARCTCSIHNSPHLDDDDEEYLKGDDLVEYLRRKNAALCRVAETYREKYVNSETEIGEIQTEHKRQLLKMRKFYQKEIFTRHSRSLTMLRAALAKDT